MEHVTGEEKYKWDILKVVVMESSMLLGRVCCLIFSRFFLGASCLYL